MNTKKKGVQSEVEIAERVNTLLGRMSLTRRAFLSAAKDQHGKNENTEGNLPIAVIGDEHHDNVKETVRLCVVDPVEEGSVPLRQCFEHEVSPV
jgi:hypothetical protein